MMPSLAAAGLAWCMAPTVGAAQTVIARVTESETSRPVAGAIVRLADSARQIVAQGLTTESGRVVLRAPSPGRYLLRADRIGHRGVWSEPFAVVDTAMIDLRMPTDRVVLPDLVVRGAGGCELQADGGQTAALWNEIQKALAAGQMTAATERIELTVRRYRKHRNHKGQLTADSTVRSYQTRGSPFVSPSPTELATHGYVREQANGGYQFSGPDAVTLLSPEFLGTHCFELTEPADRQSALVGLGFKPVKGTRRPEVRGTLWVDRASAELRSLEFEFVNVPDAVHVPGLGGQVEFARVSDGAWVVTEWYIRTPDRVRFFRRQRFGTETRDSVVGFIDEGGTARPGHDPTVALADAALGVRTGSAISGDLAIRLLDTRRRPISGADVAVAGTDTVLTSDPDGRVELRELPLGAVAFRIRAVGFRPASGRLRLTDNSRLADTTIVMQPAAQLLDSVVVTAKSPTFEAGKMENFERRRLAGFGHFLTRVELSDPLRGGLDLQLRRYARIRLEPMIWRPPCTGGYAAAVSDRGKPPITSPCISAYACPMTVYLDGVLYWSPDMGNATPPPDISKFNVLDLEAVEIYRGPAELPIEYTGPMAGCGVLLLWTRVG